MEVSKQMLDKFSKIAEEMKSKKIDAIEIANIMFDKKASLAVIIKVLYKIGNNASQIDLILEKSLWKDFNIRLDDLFFDFIELDDDLIES
jgi:hypothetical protein